MNQPESSRKSIGSADASRRDFLRTSAALAAGGALAARSALAAAAETVGAVHLGMDDTIKIALIGCGGRGTEACEQALSTAGPVKLVAMADAFRDRLDGSLKTLQGRADENEKLKGRIDVPEDRKFVGFDAYRNALDAGADLVLLTTPPGFRPIHFEAAVNAGKHVFMEKPVSTDAPGIRRVLAAAEDAKRKKLKVAVGLQRHHHSGYIETIDRLRNGAIGDIVAARAYWNGGNVSVRSRQPDWTEMEYQMRAWYNFVWLCGDHIVEQHIHNLDVINWLKNDHPVKAYGVGGRAFRKGKGSGQIYDHHAVEFEYADGMRMYSQCRQMPGCDDRVTEFADGTKGTAEMWGHIDAKGETLWEHPRDGKNPYQVEHDDLQAAIRKDAAYSEAIYGAHSTMTAILGRMATYSGKLVTWDEAINSQISLLPEKFAFDATPPVLPDEHGNYPIAVPGQTKVI